LHGNIHFGLTAHQCCQSKDTSEAKIPNHSMQMSGNRGKNGGIRVLSAFGCLSGLG
jgi:hypothetical protein